MIEARLVGARRFEMVERETPEPAAGEVLLELAFGAICGSEFAPYLGTGTEFPLYRGVVRYPRTLGHEASGIVAGLGASVENVKLGDRVVPRTAPFATHALARASDLVLVPEGVSLEHASLALMAQETRYLCTEILRVQPHERVLIVGVGPFGMLCLEHLRDIGCRSMVVADLIQGRLDLACELGATRAVDAQAVDLVDALAAERPDVVIECSGRPAAIQQALHVAAPQARLGLAARPGVSNADFTLEDVFHNFLTVVGGKIPPAGYAPHLRQRVLQMIRDERIHAARHITHRFPLDQVGEAFEVAIDARRGGLKVVVDCRA